MITLEEIEEISPKKVSQSSIDAFKRFIEQLEARNEDSDKEEYDE